MKKAFTAFVSCAVALSLTWSSPTLASTTVRVTPADPDGWASQTSPTATTAFVEGPATPPLGGGSFELAVGSDGDGAAQLRSTAYHGVALADLSALSYATYVRTNVSCQAPYVLLNIDLDGNATLDDQLFFEPCYQTGDYSGDTVPDQGDVTLDTWQTWDALGGGWWSLNAGTFGPPLTTLDTYLGAHPDARIVNSSTGLGGLRLVAGFGAGAWDDFVGNVDAVIVNDTIYDFELANCAFSDDAVTKTRTLLEDCTTDETILIPDAWTLDGDGHAITAVDPAGGHFVGAVVRNAGTSAHVRDLRVTATALADVCDGDADRLRGILFDDAAGTIMDTTVSGVRQGPSGCQEGNAIEARNFTSSIVREVTIGGNTVADYQKNGITVNGTVRGIVTGNTVTGDGPVDYIAQNGVQFGFGATGEARDNAISGNDYTPESFTAAGMLLYGVEPSMVKRSHNTFRGNEMNLIVVPAASLGD